MRHRSRDVQEARVVLHILADVERDTHVSAARVGKHQLPARFKRQQIVNDHKAPIHRNNVP